MLTVQIFYGKFRKSGKDFENIVLFIVSTIMIAGFINI